MLNLVVEAELESFFFKKRNNILKTDFKHGTRIYSFEKICISHGHVCGYVCIYTQLRQSTAKLLLIMLFNEYTTIPELCTK